MCILYSVRHWCFWNFSSPAKEKSISRRLWSCGFEIWLIKPFMWSYNITIPFCRRNS
nr:hypothetical protein Iba_chr02cCG0640 [Ipomoea batatas]